MSTVRKAVLPVAGLGTRFLPATKSMPKEMLPVVDRPLIQFAVEEARAAGIEQICFVTGRGKGVMEDHFDHAPELEATLKARGKEKALEAVQGVIPPSGNLVYSRQEKPLGLGHAVWCARHFVGNEPFAVLLPDDIMHGTPPLLTQMVEWFGVLRSSLVGVMEVSLEQTEKYGILDPEGESGGDVVKIRGMVEKPKPEKAPSNLAIVGRYILTPQIFRHLAEGRRGAGGEIQLTDAMAALLGEEPIHGVRFQGTRFDCGDKVGFQMANLALALERPKLRERLLPFLREQLERWG